MDEKDIIVTPDEAKAEQEALAEAKADEVRAKVVTDLGLTDDETNKPVIDKLVERELEHRKKLSEAIGQKIKYREAAKGAKPAQQPESKETTSLDPEQIRKQAESVALATLDQRDLDEMDYPDEIKAEIKRIAQLQNITVRKAEKDPYIQYRIGQVQQADRVIEAGVTRMPRVTGATQTLDTKKPQFDMSTEEGRKKYKEWKKQKYGN